MSDKSILVGVMMGSTSDWDGVMEHCHKTLDDLGIGHECKVLSAHRTPAQTSAYAASAQDRGIRVLIAAAGGAAHLAGVVAGHTLLPVLGVPIETKSLGGLDSLLSMVQMPAGIPVGTLSIGKAGAINAALLAGHMLGNEFPEIRQALADYRQARAQKVLASDLPM